MPRVRKCPTCGHRIKKEDYTKLRPKKGRTKSAKRLPSKKKKGGKKK